MLLDGRFQLFDVFCSALPECRLGLTVSLLSFLGSGIDLEIDSASSQDPGPSIPYWLSSAFALLNLGIFRYEILLIQFGRCVGEAPLFGVLRLGSCWNLVHV